MAIAGKVAITLATENGGAWSADVTYDRLVAVKHNNNLYISRKTVANIEPPNEEFWFLALEGFSGDDIEDIINGTTQVGNAKTLDGHGAEYFAPKTDLANYLPLTGGTVQDFSVGPTSALGLSAVTFRNSSNAIRQYLAYYHPGDLLIRYDASFNEKTILDTGNKPTGTYTGNGDATARTINIGGMGGILCIRSNANVIAFVSVIGAVVFHRTEGMKWFTDSEISYNGNLKLATSNTYLNNNGSLYTYYSL